jgi:hypothetical protein
MQQLEPYTGLLTASGALILFFGWVIDNFLKERYAKLKDSIDSAHQNMRMFSMLTDLLNSTDSLASEIVRPKLEERSRQAAESDSNYSKYSLVELEYEELKLRTLRIRRLNETIATTVDFSKSAPGITKSSQRLVQLSERVAGFERILNMQELAIHDAREKHRKDEQSTNSDDTYGEATKLIDSTIAMYEDEISPALNPLTFEYVDVANKRHSEVYNKLALAGKLSSIFSKCSIWIYVFGSAITLLAQVIGLSSKK